MKKIFLSFFAMTIMAGCATYPQQPPIYPLSIDWAVQTVCIEKNPAVSVLFEEFLSVVQDGFTRHGISSRVYLGDMPENCDYTVQYTATRGRDLAYYLGTASVTVFQGKQKIAEFSYFLDGGFSKFGSIKSKIDPLMDKMLVEYPLRP